MISSPIAPDFYEPRLAEAVERLPFEQVHALPYGAIQLDAEGKAVFYSDTERKQSRYRKEVLGHDFFAEIAPCMDNPNFRGRIDRAMAAGRVDIAMNFSAEMPSGATVDIEARVQSASNGGCWIFLKRSG